MLLDERRHFMSVKITRSNRNVFRDLGFDVEEAEHLKIRADLMIQVQKRITAGGYKQAEVAKILSVTQPRVSDLLCGRIDLFSTDALIDMLACLGVRVHLVMTQSRKARKVA
jgi:predicted XRE-type DNA-binding protein